jgi:signal transduction histidine kinase
MGNHRVGSGVPRADNANGHVGQYAAEPTTSPFASRGALRMRNWPVSTRLIAVIVLALLMGLVFGGLQIASAADSASRFGGVSQLAVLGQQVTGLTQALEDERDRTTGLLPITSVSALNGVYAATNAEAAKVQSLAAGIGGSFPANIQARVATVIYDIKSLRSLRVSAQASESALAVIVDYGVPITDMIALNDQIAQGTSDASLVNDVQTLDSLSLTKDQAAQQRGILYNAFNQQLFADGELQALQTAESEELTDLTAFNTTATPAEQSTYNNFVNNVYGTAVNQAQNIELYVVSTGVPDIGAGALNISAGDAPGVWYAAQSAKVNAMQETELQVARNIVARAQSLQGSAERSALITAIVTAVILLLVLLATVVVARSLVGPLRRLREGALNIATVELPERVRLLGEAQEPTVSLAVAPIDVLSTDEIGQVARAFDQVHSEAVRLASNEAGLRNSLNAMFVNLSRRSQSLIERLVRMIDSLEQNEGDPERLSNLFAMDHLVTRMRRNSENLLLLAGHESARKWSDPVSLADVARAAVSEIEHYSRVSLKVQPGIAVTGPAVSDVVHLLAEVIENATIYSAKDTPVHVATQEPTSGGVLIEVSDSGVGIPDTRLAEINWRLDNPPVIDVSVSRHMGLYAVAHLAERHGVRVRLRPRSPHGLSALVWLPDTITEREANLYGGRSWNVAAQPGLPGRGAAGGFAMTARPFADVRPTRPFTDVRPTRPFTDVQPASHRRDVVVAEPAMAVARETGPVSAATSDWFRSRTSVGPVPGNGSAGSAVATADGGGGSWTDERGGSGTDGRAGSGTDERGGSGTDGWAVGKHAAQIIAEPVHGDFTAAGLPTRVPRANLLPGSATGGMTGGGGTGRPGPATDAQAATTPRAPRAPRSPDVARNRLSGFQHGTRRAKGLDPSVPDSGEEQTGELLVPPGPELARHRLHHASPGCRARGRGVGGRSAAGALGPHPVGVRRPARGHHLGADQPDAGRGAAVRGRPGHPGPGGDGRRADARHGHQRRLQPDRADGPGMRHGPGGLRDDAAGRGGRRRADPGRSRRAGSVSEAPRRRLARPGSGRGPVGIAAA